MLGNNVSQRIGWMLYPPFRNNYMTKSVSIWRQCFYHLIGSCFPIQTRPIINIMAKKINLLLRMMKYLKLHGRKYARLRIRMSSTSVSCFVYLSLLVIKKFICHFYLMDTDVGLDLMQLFVGLWMHHTYQLDLVDSSVKLVFFRYSTCRLVSSLNEARASLFQLPCACFSMFLCYIFSLLRAKLEQSCIYVIDQSLDYQIELASFSLRYWFVSEDITKIDLKII